MRSGAYFSGVEGDLFLSFPQSLEIPSPTFAVHFTFPAHNQEVKVKHPPEPHKQDAAA
jgi:hypothetical protein